MKHSQAVNQLYEQYKGYARAGVQQSQQPSWLHIIPKDTKLEILSKMTHAELGAIAATCTEFNILSDEDFVWEKLLKNRWQYEHRGVAARGNLKEIYKTRLINWRRRQMVMCNVEAGGVERDYHKLGIRGVIHEECVASCKHLHHTLLIPFKLIGLLMYPVYLYIKKRQSHSTPLSFIGYVAVSANNSVIVISWWTIHKISLRSIVLMFCMAVNEVALLCSVFNYIFLWIQAFGNMQLQNTVPMEIMQTILFPFMVSFQILFTFILPTFFQFNYYTAYLVWYFMSANMLYISIQYLAYFPSYLPFKQIVRLLSFTVTTVKLSWKFIEKIFIFIWSRLKFTGNRIGKYISKIIYNIFQMLIKILSVANRTAFSLLGFYANILATMTRVCRDMGLFGEIILIPLVFGWILWPLIVPYLVQSKVLYIPAGGASMFLLKKGYDIIKRSY